MIPIIIEPENNILPIVSTRKVPVEIAELASKFWEVDDPEFTNCIFKSKSFRFVNIQGFEDKYVFLKIYNFSSNNKVNFLGRNTSYTFFSKNSRAKVIEFIEDQSTRVSDKTIIFGLSKTQFKKMCKSLNVLDPENVELNALLFLENKKPKVYFFLQNLENTEQAKAAIKAFEKPGSSGVKVPKGSA